MVPPPVQQGDASTPRKVAVAAVLGLLTVFAFAPALANGFAASWDDGPNFLENPYYRGLGWAELGWAWRATLLGVYQPLAWHLLSAEFVLWGLDPWGYHLVSVLGHAANACLFFVLASELLARAHPDLTAGDRTFGAALAAATFAVHPLRVEVVAWVSCQPYLPCAGFCLLSLLAYLHAHDGGRPVRRLGCLAAAWILCLAALLCKAAAVGLPLVLLVLDVYPLRRLGGGRGLFAGASARSVWLEKLPFFALGTTFAVVSFGVRQSLGSFGQPWRLGSAVAQSCYAITFYPAKTIVPTGLMPFHPTPSRIGLDDPRFLLPIAGVAGLSCVLWMLRQGRPGLLAAWVSYLLLLAPSSGLIRTGPMFVADRYSYPPSMAGFVLASGGFASLSSWGRRLRVHLGVWMVALGLVASLVTLTWRQCQVWRDSHAPWEHAAACCAAALQANPISPEAHHNLGVTRYRCGRLDEAIDAFRSAVRYDPRFAQAWGSLGQALADSGRSDSAIEALAEAVRLDPDSAELRGALAVVLVQRGRLEEALPSYRAAIRREPGNADWHIGLGVVLYRLGRLDEAASALSEAVRIDPHSPLTKDYLRRIRAARDVP